MSKERNKRPLLKDMYTMSAAPVRCILSKSELDPDLGIRGGGGGERGNGHPDPNIRAGGQTPKKIFQPFGPQFSLKIRGDPPLDLILKVTV